MKRTEIILVSLGTAAIVLALTAAIIASKHVRNSRITNDGMDGANVLLVPLNSTETYRTGNTPEDDEDDAPRPEDPLLNPALVPLVMPGLNEDEEEPAPTATPDLEPEPEPAFEGESETTE